MPQRIESAVGGLLYVVNFSICFVLTLIVAPRNYPPIFTIPRDENNSVYHERKSEIYLRE